MLQEFDYFLCDPFNYGKHNTDVKIPKIGDKIIIKNDWFDHHICAATSQEIIKISKEPYQIIEEVAPIVININNNNEYRYSCKLEGYCFQILDYYFNFTK